MQGSDCYKGQHGGFLGRGEIRAGWDWDHPLTSSFWIEWQSSMS